MKKILIADDEENLQLLYKTELEEEGYSVVMVNNGTDALNELEKNSYDLILLDIMMPDIDGLSVLQQLKTKYPQLPVILNTAYGNYQHDFSAWAAETFIVKSSDLSQLKSKIKEIIGN